MPVADTPTALNRKLIGHYNYFGGYAFCMTFKMLRRRGQKHSINQEKFGELWNTVYRTGNMEVRTDADLKSRMP